MSETRRSTRARDLKVFITTLSLAATVGGWAIFSQANAIPLTNDVSAQVSPAQTSTQTVSTDTTVADQATPSPTTRASLSTASTSAPAAVAVTRSSR